MTDAIHFVFLCAIDLLIYFFLTSFAAIFPSKPKPIFVSPNFFAQALYQRSF